MLISACHAIHMLVRNPENCAAACRAGAHVPVTRMAQLARSAELAGGATPAAGTLCHLAESSAHARTLLRDAGAAEPLASLILVSAETGSAGDSAASKFAGFALLSLVQEEPQVVIDAVDKVCRGEPQFSRALETSCPECLEMLQKHVMSRLRVAMDGSDVKVLQDLLALGHGVNLTAGFLKDAKAKFRAVMQRAEESNKARGADKAGGADKAKTEAANGPPSRRAASRHRQGCRSVLCGHLGGGGRAAGGVASDCIWRYPDGDARGVRGPRPKVYCRAQCHRCLRASRHAGWRRQHHQRHGLRTTPAHDDADGNPLRLVGHPHGGRPAAQ